ncbi:hypothetical protein N7481_007943 [Penicillium waksmanii]|uniref:uncharacterized protein n=1 Tax=Penicillium waksmanii TaxID=69791 RepID=UPI0025498379|nr:uncharacterized protein N7481_007943 [Penicillium waksmanii]KAJ5980645.1 hypothetical protein N7481_007943 [Penicillium waksmanii]
MRVVSRHTHYYQILDPIAPEWHTSWPQLIRDVPRIVEAVRVEITGPSHDDEIITPILADTEHGIYLNGVRGNSGESLEKKGTFNIIKTGRKPYDVVVTCILLRAYNLAPNVFNLRLWDEWIKGREIYERLWPNEAIQRLSGGSSGEVKDQFTWSSKQLSTKGKVFVFNCQISGH